MRDSELLWYRSRIVWLWCCLFFSSPASLFVRGSELPSRSPGLVRFVFLVLCDVGVFVMAPPCSPVLMWMVWPSSIPLFFKMSLSLR